MDLGGVSRSLLLCLLLGCPKNLLNFTLAASGSPSPEQKSLQGSGTTTNPTQPDNGEKTPVELNIKTKKNGSGFSYSCASGIGTYIADSGFGFNLVKRDNEIIWETARENEYAKKVVSNGLKWNASITNVTVHLYNGAIKNFVKGDNKWKVETIQRAKFTDQTTSGDSSKKTTEASSPETKENNEDSGKPGDGVTKEGDPKESQPTTPNSGSHSAECKKKPQESSNPNHIDIDLTKTESSDQYEYKQEGDVETYSVKGDFLIKSYKEGANLKWESDGTRYLKKVVRIRITDGTYKYQIVTNKPVVSVQKAAGAPPETPGDSQTRTGDNGPKVTPPEKCPQPNEIVIITQDPTDNALLSVDDTNQYKIEKKDKEYFIEFNPGSKCVELIIEGKVAWEYGSKGIQECPRIFRVNNMAELLVIFADADSISRMKSCFDGTWLGWT